MNEVIETRFDPAPTTEGEFSGYAVTWGTVDSYRTAFAPGAFAASLGNGRPVALLWSHDPAAPVGTITEIREDERGLFVRARLTLTTTRGREAYELLKAKAVNGLSVGFVRRRDEAMAGGRRITEAAVKEVSLVTLPSNEDARVHEVRGDTAAKGAAQPKGKDMAEETVTDAAPEEQRGNDNTELETRMSEVTGTLDGIKSTVEGMGKRMDKIEARAGRAGVAAGGGDDDQAAVETRAFTAFVRRGREAMGADEVRSLTVADDTSGGYLAPSDFRAQVIKGIGEISPIRQHATVTSTAAGELVMPKLTGRPTAVWVGETEDRSSTEPTFGQITIPAHEASVYIDVSQKLLEDSAINVASELSAMLATEYARLEGVAFVSGNGVGKPRGVMAHGDLPSMKNGSTSALDADKLIALMYAITAAYRSRAKWFMNGSTIAAVRSLKSSTSGEYLFKESLADGVPPTLLGKPVIEVSDMDDATSGKLPILFGDMAAAYRVVDRVGLSLLRDPYTQATSGLVRFHSRRRVGADLVLPEAVKALAMTSS